MMALVNIRLENDEVDQGIFRDLDVVGYRLENRARCVLRFQNKKMDDNSRQKLNELYQMLQAARQIHSPVVRDECVNNQ